VRRLAAALIGLAIAVFVVGVALALLIQPPVTLVVAERFALAREAGLPRQRMLEIAEQVRAFVAGTSAQTLPGVVDGRPGFDEAAIAHLADVRSVIAGARIVTWGLALLLAVWLAAEVAGRRFDRIAAGMRAGAWWCLGLVLVAGLAGVFNFDALFSAFHGLFFAAGTWTFPSDSLLIQTFPEPFWATAAGLWAGIVLLGGAALGVGARLAARGDARPASIRESGSVGHGA